MLTKIRNSCSNTDKWKILRYILKEVLGMIHKFLAWATEWIVVLFTTGEDSFMSHQSPVNKSYPKHLTDKEIEDQKLLN